MQNQNQMAGMGRADYPSYSRFRIGQLLYKMSHESVPITEGDLVLDTYDGCVGVAHCLDFEPGYCAVGSEGVSESRVPLSRLIRLEVDDDDNDDDE